MSDKEVVLALDDQEREAALQRDIETLKRLWSDRFTVNAPNNEVVTGKHAVLDTFVHSGIIDFLSYARHIEHIELDGGFAIIMGLETLVPKNDAPSAGLVAGRSVNRRFTNIWKQEAGTWRLFARHANVIPHR